MYKVRIDVEDEFAGVVIGEYEAPELFHTADAARLFLAEIMTVVKYTVSRPDSCVVYHVRVAQVPDPAKS